MMKTLKTQLSIDKSVFFDEDVPPYHQFGAFLKHLFQPPFEVVSLSVVVRLLLLEVEFGDICLPVFLPKDISASICLDEETRE